MTRRVALFVLPLALLIQAPAAFAAGHWIMGGPVAALASIQRIAHEGTPGMPASAEPTPVSVSPTALAPLTLGAHRVRVALDNGFARTEVTQTWHNPNAQALEARYAVPLPKNASLSEMTIKAGDVLLSGEVRPKDEAEKIYQEEKSSGRDAGVAKKDEYRTFEFAVARVAPGATIEVRFVYYQPLAIDTGVARYVYPNEQAGTSEGGASFWQPNVTSNVPVELSATVRTAWPVDDVRCAGIDGAARVTRRGPGDLTAEATVPAGRDAVLYYRLATGLPGRVELIPYRGAQGGAGTFMAVLTPGADLPLIKNGADHVFVLDVSGSMRLRLPVLQEGVKRALTGLSPADRFRIISFNSAVTVLTPEPIAATPEGIARGHQLVDGLSSDGGTNLFDALEAGLKVADEDRVTNVILVTDGVTNQGALSPQQFHALISRADVRFHGFLLGDEANWPLMDTIARASGGHYQTVSNADDILGLLVLARGKLKSEAIHDVKVELTGAEVTDLTRAPTRVFHGEQVVVFGRYTQPCKARLTMTAKIAGKSHEYATDVELPALDTRTPEVERLHAMARCEELKQLSDAGLMDGAAAAAEITRLGVAAQIVTDETSMVMLTDGQFAARGISRSNQARTGTEATARTQREAAPAPSYRVDVQRPTYTAPAPHVADPPRYNPPSYGGGGRSSGRGGGAFDPLSGALVLALAGLSLVRRSEDE